jgi:hypothetical protein
VTEQLTPADLEVLEFARAPWKSIGRRTDAIYARFGETETRFFQRLHVLLNNPAAIAYDPDGVRRLLDRRDLLRARRTMGAHQ